MNFLNYFYDKSFSFYFININNIQDTILKLYLEPIKIKNESFGLHYMYNGKYYSPILPDCFNIEYYYD